MTLNPYEVVTSPKRTAAADRAEQIRLGLQSTAVLYARAVAEEDWRVLGYSNVTDWAKKEFGPDRFSTERRKEIVALLSESGYTVRQIAKATGAGKSTVARDQRSVPAGTPGDNGQVTENQSARQQAARDREAAARDRRHFDEEAEIARRLSEETQVLTEAEMQALVDEPVSQEFREQLAETMDQNDELLQRLADNPVPHAHDDPDPRAMQRYDPTAAYEYNEQGQLMGPKPVPPLSQFVEKPLPHKITDADIEVIISENLTRGQIRTRFGVGEHAAQLARVAAVAIQGERKRSARDARNSAKHAYTTQIDVGTLRTMAERYFEYRATQHLNTMTGTDRTKVTLFLDWLENW